MNLRSAALVVFTLLLAACQSSPSNNDKTAWLMQGGEPWVSPDGECMQLRPLAPEEKHGFCYDVMIQSYQKRHHYESLDPQEFGFLYPHVEPTADTAYNLVPPASEAQELAALQAESFTPLPYIKQIYTARPFDLNKARLSKANRLALQDTFQAWRNQGIRIVSVQITGHTDVSGPKDFNFALSRWRAESVSYFLRHRLKIPGNDIALGGAGMLNPNPKGNEAADDRYVDLKVWLEPPRGSTEKLAVHPVQEPALWLKGRR